MVSIAQRWYSVADLERLRDASPSRYELIEGEVFVAPSPATVHQRVSRRTEFAFDRTLTDLGLGEVFDAPYDVHLGPDTVVQPDLVVVLNDRASIIGPDHIDGAPSLVVEILSPSSRRTDAVTKRAAYARAGVPEYWLMDAEACLVVVQSEPVGDEYRQTTIFQRTDVAVATTIPALAVDLPVVFAGIEPS
ncbi:MAG: Uma2 family endonuclease [Chloroflexia bacterium]|nr:Uma2 family endonuclease [Chloroflexia bacterium]